MLPGAVQHCTPLCHPSLEPGSLWGIPSEVPIEGEDRVEDFGTLSPMAGRARTWGWG